MAMLFDQHISIHPHHLWNTKEKCFLQPRFQCSLFCSQGEIIPFYCSVLYCSIHIMHSLLYLNKSLCKCQSFVRSMKLWGRKCVFSSFKKALKFLWMSLGFYIVETGWFHLIITNMKQRVCLILSNDNIIAYIILVQKECQLRSPLGYPDMWNVLWLLYSPEGLLRCNSLKEE